MLDTNFCIDLIRGKSPAAFEKFRSIEIDQIGVSSITVAELWYGAAKSKRREHNETLLLKFCAPLEIAAFDPAASAVYGTVRAKLEASGTPIGPLDMLIAAHAIATKSVMVTANAGEFARVDGLVVQNWRSIA